MPVKTGFQVDMEIYKDNLSQSGNRILSSHITMVFVALGSHVILHGAFDRLPLPPLDLLMTTMACYKRGTILEILRENCLNGSALSRENLQRHLLLN